MKEFELVASVGICENIIISTSRHTFLAIGFLTFAFLSPPVHIARWAHMHHFLSVHLSSGLVLGRFA